MKILLDAMGGDNAPKSTVQGAADAVKEFGDGMTLALLGDEAKIKAAAQEPVSYTHLDVYKRQVESPAKAKTIGKYLGRG